MPVKCEAESCQKRSGRETFACIQLKATDDKVYNLCHSHSESQVPIRILNGKLLLDPYTGKITQANQENS